MPNAAATYQPHTTIRSPLGYEPLSRPSAYRRGYGGKRWVGSETQGGYGGLRGLIYRRDEGRCRICGRMCVPKDAGGTDRSAWPHIDHVIPRSRGGSDDPENLQLTCGSCNAAKRHRDAGIRR